VQIISKNRKITLSISKKLILPVAFAGMLTVSAGAQTRDITGTFVNETGGTKVRLVNCDAGVCGTVIWMRNPVKDVKNPDASKRDRPVVGLQAVTLKPTGSGTYAGSLYDTESGKTYSGKAKLAGEDVELSGCVLGGLICKTSVWKRSE
jgi:uncharacterized protein (DUF2147 family)